MSEELRNKGHSDFHESIIEFIKQQDIELQGKLDKTEEDLLNQKDSRVVQPQQREEEEEREQLFVTRAMQNPSNNTTGFREDHFATKETTIRIRRKITLKKLARKNTIEEEDQYVGTQSRAK